MEKYYYNTLKPDTKHLHEVGSTVSFSSKLGGGKYVVVGHLNCERCKTVLEQREWVDPTRKAKKRNTYDITSMWCFLCGLYKGASNTLCTGR